MINYDQIFTDIKPFGMPKTEKCNFLTEILTRLTIHHYDNCAGYKNILNALGFNVRSVRTYHDFPFIPVRLFKEFDLASVDRDKIVKTMTSSGTTGQSVSKIYVDKTTSQIQSKMMVKIVSSFISSARVPMLIIDSENIMSGRNMFSARSGAILGFTIFGRDKLFALDDDMGLRTDAILEFLGKYKGGKILLFGFTFMIWRHFLGELAKAGIKLDIGDGVLIHGGGWKKLAGAAVTRSQFREAVREYCGIEKVHDYYGMVEQGSAIYMECEFGHMHASSYSDIIIRRSGDFSLADTGEKGIIQAVSISPLSYPGHSVLTEDIGVALGEDDCPCGRKGKYFEIIGRLEMSEARGCSDTYEL